MLRAPLRVVVAAAFSAALVASVPVTTFAAGSWSTAAVNGGNNTPPSVDNLRGLSMFSSTGGFSVGGFGDPVALTQTGSDYRFSGAAWNYDAKTPAGAPFFYDVAALDTSNAWAVGNCLEIYRWDGSTWTLQTTPTTTCNLNSSAFRGIDFIPAVGPIGPQGWAVGSSGRIFYTIGGTTWLDKSKNPVTNSNWTTNKLRDVQFLPDGQGWAVGDSGVIIHSSDFGNSWSTQANPAATASAFPGAFAELGGVNFTSDTNGWAVGISASINLATSSQTPVRSWILKTTDGGTTWTDVTPVAYTSSPGVLVLSNASFIDANNGWIAAGDLAGDGIILSTQNGSSATPTFTAQTLFPASATAGFPLFDIQFFDACHGYTVGANRTAAVFTCPAPPPSPSPSPAPSPSPSPSPTPTPGLPKAGAEPPQSTPGPGMPLLLLALFAAGGAAAVTVVMQRSTKRS